MLETAMDLQLLHRAATAYYVDDMRQADVAAQLGVSRPTVSKLLTEARRIGMVRIEVLDVPAEDTTELASGLRDLLGIDSVRIAPGDQRERGFRGLGAEVGQELSTLGLRRGDVLLLSSGKTVHAVSGMRSLPQLPGVIVVPTVGGQQEPEATYQTNEIVRRFADATGADPRFLFAPAQPSARLWRSLQADPSYRAIRDLWERARVVIVGVGAPYDSRESFTSVVPTDEPSLAGAAGDVCLHFFGADGGARDFPGSDRLVRLPRELLTAVPTVIAVAEGHEKAPSILAGAKAGLFTALVTDAPTASAVLALADRG